MRLNDLAQAALRKRFPQEDVDAEGVAEAAAYLRWAIIRDAARLLRPFHLPVMRRIARETNEMAPHLGIPDIDLGPGEFLLMRLAVTVSTLYLARLPDAGLEWNAYPAQRHKFRMARMAEVRQAERRYLQSSHHFPQLALAEDASPRHEEKALHEQPQPDRVGGHPGIAQQPQNRRDYRP